MSRVCRLWYKVSIIPSMWHNIDLTGAWFKERYKSESQLRWLCTYRLTQVQDLNIGMYIRMYVYCTCKLNELQVCLTGQRML